MGHGIGVLAGLTWLQCFAERRDDAVHRDENARSEYLSAAADASVSSCRKIRRSGRRLLVPPTRVLKNFSQTRHETLLGKAPFHTSLHYAIAALADVALAIRIWTSTDPSGTSLLRDWMTGWCIFLERLKIISFGLPLRAFVISALNTSAAAIVQEALPREVLAYAAGMANGKTSVELAFMHLHNVSLIFEQYLEHALLLGEETLRFGRQRVTAAQFHGESSNGAFVGHAMSNRADVLLWTLESSNNYGNRSSLDPSPLVLELGANTGKCAERLLQEHSTLRWIGVDSYGDVFGDFEAPGGEAMLVQARTRLKLWLGTRAQLLIAESGTAFHGLVGKGSIDLLFVDGDHSENAVRKDLADWAPRVRPDGVVAGHDYNPRFMGVVHAVHSALPYGTTLHLGPDMVFWWHVPT